MNTANQFQSLEIHDDEISGITHSQDNNGDWSVILYLNTKSGERRLTFSCCRAIQANVRGGMARKDVIGKYTATAESKFFRDADEWPSPLKKGALHFSITTNSGSSLDVVAESFRFD